MNKTLGLVLVLSSVYLGILEARVESFLSYFPIKDQYRWTYLVSEENKTFHQTVVCVVPAKGVKTACDFIQQTESIRQTRYYYQKDADWIYLTRIDVVWSRFPVPLTFNVQPRLPIYPLNPKLTKSYHWKWQGSISSLLHKKTISADFVMTDNESIKTKFGTYPALKIMCSYLDNKKPQWLESWYAIGIGLVSIKSPGHSKQLSALPK